MGATDTIRAYYDALEAEAPLAPFFANRDETVKIGIFETLIGYEEIEAGLDRQTNETTDWSIDSNQLTVAEQYRVAHFFDSVEMQWTDIQSGTTLEFSTRWTGTLERAQGTEHWEFLTMHVSTSAERP